MGTCIHQAEMDQWSMESAKMGTCVHQAEMGQWVKSAKMGTCVHQAASWRRKKDMKTYKYIFHFYFI